MYLYPPNNVKAIFGGIRQLFPPYPPYSEYNVLRISDWASLKKMVSFFADMALPWYRSQTTQANKSEPVETEHLKLLEGRLGYAQRLLHPEDPDTFTTEEGKVFKGEAWIYINGIITNRAVAMLNGEYLAELFGRKIEVIHNPTDAILADLLETIAGRLWRVITRADQFAYNHLLSILKKEDIKKVVWIAHSQGTVITSNVLRLMRERHPELLVKLEIYTVANCADRMEIQKDKKGRPVPYIEHFANTDDLVGKLGVLAHAAKKRGDVRLDGPIFVRKAWGHLLNAHYLEGIEHKEYIDPEGVSTSRLYGYLHGAIPLELAPISSVG